MGHRNKKPKISKKPNPNDIIKQTNIDNRQTNLVISYKYLVSTSKYSLDNINDNKAKIQHYKKYFEKISEYCLIDNFKEKITSDIKYSTANHIHPIDWSSNSIKEDGFTSLEEKLWEQIRDDCWQLGIDNQGFRVHGFFIENVFYIVWIDAEHSLYNRK